MEKYINLPTLVLFSFITKSLILGATISDSVIVTSLSALFAFHFYISSKKEPKANKELWDRMIELEEQHKVVKEKVNSINLGTSLKR